jgi:hypothetical protein
MDELFRVGRAWAPVAKTAILFALPLPLLFASLWALGSGQMTQFALASGALASLWGGAILTLRGLIGEARFLLGQTLDPPPTPFKALGLGLTGLGALLGAMSAGHGLIGALVFAALAAFGHGAFFGRDLRPRTIEIPSMPGVDSGEVTELLKRAYAQLLGIETAARSIRVPEFGDRLSRIVAWGRRILAQIEENPRDASRARKFLAVYLDGTERVTQQYAKTHAQARNAPLEENFRRLLVDMESTFASQHAKLLERETTALDVEIEVLNARLRQEGIA